MSGPPGQSVAVPSPSLPKGGGAIRGIGEKFAANPVTGTGSLTIPLAGSPGRSGFSPQLSLSYDSGAGNGPFGFGWDLALPSITRKTDKGVPRYDRDSEDIFMLVGAEDLVPVIELHAGRWQHIARRRILSGREYLVHRYRPRIESAFTRIERWTDLQGGDAHWRLTSRDNVTTVYGATPESRIADPDDPTRIFSWLICESYEDTGNAIVYVYKAENDEGVDQHQPHERNRGGRARSANRYLKRIKYGNRGSRLMQPDLTQADWMFEIVFDYGEHDRDNPGPEEQQPWLCRHDPFSTRRPGFEVRSYRLCQRVLMFHHFPDAPDVGRGCLVRSTDFVYRDSRGNPDDQMRGHPIASFIASVTQQGYRRQHQGGYARRALPAVELRYSQAVIDETVRALDPATLANLPQGLDGGAYRWVDLDGEGVSGILTEQAGAWFYKPNLGDGCFGPARVAQAQPSLTGGRQELLDLAGDGQLELVDFGGSTPGFFERDPAQGWMPFRLFRQRPSIQWDDPNMRFVDLTGDGLADILISGDGTFTWHRSLGEDGFGPAQRVHQALDEERGPHLVLAGRAQSIYLADMSGDGLADLVRIRNGEVSYWPNLGHGRFGAKVTMDQAPWCDEPDQYDARRVLLVDIDGSGTADLIYLHRDGVRISFNCAGNGWSSVRTLKHAFPRIENVSNVSAVDLLGNGTACLVWSSSLPSDAGRQVRYIDLMGGQKPHLLVGVKNNLGAETKILYAPSTRFYLADKAAGRPWVTRLPFPVHVVERIETIDHLSHNRFGTRFAYHHGYFDGVEREFRGFGLVEQWDTETFLSLRVDDVSWDTNLDATTHVPPVLTRTWFHTGAHVDGDRISRQFAAEYYREGSQCAPDGDALLLDDTVLPATLRRPGAPPLPWQLTPTELREACRAIKGSMLRQEVYAEDGSEAAARPYTVTERSYTIELLQPAGEHVANSPVDHHAVFFVHPRETITAHYERMLYQVDGRWRHDPRVNHQLVLAVDDYGNVLRSVAIGYGRRHADPSLVLTSTDRARQGRTHMTYTERSHTNPVEQPDAYRTPRLAEVRTWELLGLMAGARRQGPTDLLSFDEVGVQLEAVADDRHDLPVERWDVDPERLGAPTRRLIEHERHYYRRDDLAGPLPLGSLDSLGLPFESHRLALPSGLLADLYRDQVDDAMLSEAGYVPDDGWWMPSGRVFYSPGSDDGPEVELEHARRHFFLARRFRNPFGAITSVSYDADDLLVQETRDAVGNVITAGERDPQGRLVASGNDYRVLQPQLVMDANRNRAAVAFDTLGMVVGTAVMGKPEERMGDSLEGFTPDLDDTVIAAYLADPGSPQRLLQKATTRLIYDLFAYWRTRDDPQPQPPVVATLAGETHVPHRVKGQRDKVQQSFAYSDGFGREIQKKLPAEPGPMPSRRWIGSGWTIYNNKGKPVRQYEPFFSSSHRFEFAVLAGVTAVPFYDPVERVIATLHPNNTWEKLVFNPWRQNTWDVNDTVLIEPQSDDDVGGYVRHYLAGLEQQSGGWATWYSGRVDGALGPQERIAAAKAAAHAGTPAQTWFDSLGRSCLVIAHNRVRRHGEAAEQYLPTRMVLDIEGNTRAIVDARGRTVVRYGYDMLGNRLRQESMEAGWRLSLVAVDGKTTYSWNARGFQSHIEYDPLRRPLRTFVSDPDDPGRKRLHARTEYGEGQPDDLRWNLRGKVFRQHDGAGVVTNETYDFKGNLLHASRQLAAEYRQSVDLRSPVSLEERVYSSHLHYDALNRPIVATAPDGSIVRTSYNEANLLERVDANLRGDEEVTVVVSGVDYNARGQRTSITYGNGAQTDYAYDPLTFRLTAQRTRQGDTTLQELTYIYDPIGNITHIDDKAQQAVYFRNRRVDPHAAYTYDAIYQLVEATGREHLGQTAGGPSATKPSSAGDGARTRLAHPNDGNAMARYLERYEYDAVGNVLQVLHRGADQSHAGWKRIYRYAEPSPLEPGATSNRLTTTTTVGDDASRPITYDAHGNITSMPELPGMAWNHNDQLQATTRQQVGDGGVPETTYHIYDAAGQRVRKVTDGMAAPGGTPAPRQERIYLGGFELSRTYGAGGELTLERESLHILDDRQRIALVEQRTVGEDDGMARLLRYQLADQLGSVSVELDGDGRIISYEEYYPYGSTAYQAVRSQVETPKRYRYTGKERDQESGLYHNGVRYYAPWLGRWTSCDPIGTETGVNLYRYVSNNPIIKQDPTGFDEITIYHRTTEESAAAMSRAGARTDVSRSHVWAGGGFYGLDTPSIPASSGAQGDVIVAQRISVDKVQDLTNARGLGARLTDAFEDSQRGRSIRSEIYRQMYDAGDSQARTMGRRPSDADVDRYFRDYMNQQINKVAPNADVIKWRNADGTFTYVARRSSALVGAPTIAGRITPGGFVAGASAPRAATDAPAAKTAAPSPEARVTTVAEAGDLGSPSRLTGAADDAADALGSTARRFGRRALMAIPVVDIVTQQVTYEESAYTGSRPLDAFLNLTIAEVWEIPLAIYSGVELTARGLMYGGEKAGNAVNSALDYVSREFIAPVAAPLEQEIKKLYGVPY